MAEFESTIKYIIDNLEIEIDQERRFGPVETIKVKLLLSDNVISESWCDLPDANV